MLTRAFTVSSVVLVVFLVAPLLIILPVSLTDDRVLSLPQAGLSLQHYHRLMGSQAWLGAAAQSAVIGAVSATLASVLAFLAASAVWLNPGRTAKAISCLIVLPLIIPSIITALGLFRVYVTTGLLDTWIGIMLAHTILGLPYAFVLCLAGLANLPPALFQTARSLGAPPAVALILVVMPANMVALLSGWIFAFLNSWDELIVTIFVASRTIQTLPMLMWDGLQENLDPIIAAVAVLLLVLSTSLLLLIRLLQIHNQKS